MPLPGSCAVTVQCSPGDATVCTDNHFLQRSRWSEVARSLWAEWNLHLPLQNLTRSRLALESVLKPFLVLLLHLNRSPVLGRGLTVASRPAGMVIWLRMHTWLWMHTVKPTPAPLPWCSWAPKLQTELWAAPGHCPGPSNTPGSEFLPPSCILHWNGNPACLQCSP